MTISEYASRQTYFSARARVSCAGSGETCGVNACKRVNGYVAVGANDWGIACHNDGVN